MILSSSSLSFRHIVLLDQNTNCCFLSSAAGFKNHQTFISMFPLEEEPICFMEHFGCGATEDEVRAENNNQISTMDKRRGGT